MAYGNVNVDTVTTSTAGGVLGAGNASIMKNRIINGAMTINQRGFSGNPTTGQYTLDRWLCYNTQSAKYSVSQNAGSVTPPVGFPNYLGVTSLAATTLGASDYFAVTQYIEGYNWADLGFGTASAKTVTLSFQVYSSLTGTFGGSLQNYAETRSYPFTYSVPVANTWTTISITIPGDTGGTWVGASNAGAVQLNFGLGVGSTGSGTAGSWASAFYWSATGATSVVGTNGATFYITGVQLEVGSSATGFEYRQYGQELALCQRYYIKYSGNNSMLGLCGQTSGTSAGKFPFPIFMRATPSANFSGVALNDTLVNATINSAGVDPNSNSLFVTYGTSASTLTSARPALVYCSSAGYIDFSAEL